MRKGVFAFVFAFVTSMVIVYVAEYNFMDGQYWLMLLPILIVGVIYANVD